MGPTDLLRVVGSVLDRIGCQRFTTGSVASMIYGEPRFTNDIDVVVRMDERQAREFAASFDGVEWYVSPGSPACAGSRCPTVARSPWRRPRTSSSRSCSSSAKEVRRSTCVTSRP